MATIWLWHFKQLPQKQVQAKHCKMRKNGNVSFFSFKVTMFVIVLFFFQRSVIVFQLLVDQNNVFPDFLQTEPFKNQLEKQTVNLYSL
jgi:hypothetical protein